MALVFNNTSEVLLGEHDKLDYQPINNKLNLLCEYDKAISRSFVNSIGIWHCSWYYDSTVSGYSEGDMVWLNTEDPYEFVNSHYRIIKDYTDLKSEILTKLPEYDDKNEAIVEKYLNALSGYSDSKSKNARTLEPIFDLGNYSNPVQLAVSTKNNNKSLVSDDSAWKKLFVDSEDSEEKIRNLIQFLKEEQVRKHLIDYHLSGKEEIVQSQLSDYLDAPETRIPYDSLPSAWYSTNDSEYGFDYVTNYVRKPLVLSGTVSQYQAVRYWKSGWIEQFGTVATDNPIFAISGGSFFRVPFDWKIVGDKSGAKAYDTGELAQNSAFISVDETEESYIDPKDNFINAVFERNSISVEGSDSIRPFRDSNYSIVVYPVFQTQDGIENNYIEVNYGDVSGSNKWNSNFLTEEIIEESKSKTGFSMKLGSRILPPYISYYATGIGDF